jgi:4'-phosphopantetheinyl transferase
VNLRADLSPGRRWAGASAGRDGSLGLVTPVHDAPLNVGDVRLTYRLVEGLSLDEYRATLQKLSVEERQRAERFVMAADRERFVAAHWLLRKALSECAPVEPEAWHFVSGESGKPRLAEDQAHFGLSFNLSHTSGLVACAVARRDVGVDGESIDRRVSVLEIASRFFSPTEVAWLQEGGEDDRRLRFFSLWTLKEAYVKGLGVGLSHPLDTFGFRLGNPPVLSFQAPDGTDSAAWHFSLFAPSPCHRLACAVRREQDTAPRVTARGTPDGAPIAPVFSTP